LLLKECVRILLDRNVMIHAKTATIDGNWSTVGTANIGRLSLTGKYEANLESMAKISPRPCRRYITWTAGIAAN
jgi:phosphatidylserine/phosphatidylglycerophosphate/cardiolipin synthase-like enzyme